MSKPKECPFCSKLMKKEYILENNLCFAVIDRFPVTEGHTLIIPKRHFSSYFNITEEELLALNELIQIRKNQLLKEDRTIDGFNIGVNSGEVAGQTINHCHIHLIPRRIGDTENPKGGVRGVIPKKMHY